MTDNLRSNRHYKTTGLPTLTKEVQESERQEIVFTIYREVCNSWRLLTDVRFKLLGLLPVVSGALLVSLLSHKTDGPTSLARAGIALFGLLINIALFVYEKRNSELYDDLISRGRKIEEELGINTGIFLGRRQPTYKWIRHDVAINLTYGTSFAAWLGSLLIIYLGM